MACYIKINGTPRNYRLGSLSLSWAKDSPKRSTFLTDADSPEGLPQIGQKVEIFLSDDTKRFSGTIDEIGREGLYQGSYALQVPITVAGYDVRMYNRVARNRFTGVLPRFKSYSTVVNTSGTSVSRVDTTDSDRFDPELVGKSVTIGGNTYTVSTVPDPDHLTLGTSAGTQTGATLEYKVYSGDVFKALVDNAGPYMDYEGFSTTPQSVDNGAQIDELFFGPEPMLVSDCIQKLIELNPTFSWWEDDLVAYFKDQTNVSAPVEFTDVSGAYRRDLGVTVTREDVRNVELSVINWSTINKTTDTINGSTSSPKKSWFLTKPLAQFSSLKLNGVESTSVSTDPTSDSDYYYAPNTRQLWQNDALPAPADGDVLTIDYYPVGDNIQEYEDSQAVSDRNAVEGTGSGRYEKIIDRTKAVGQVEALAEAQNSVARFKNDMESVRGVTWEEGLAVAQIVTIQTDKYGILGDYYIDSMTASDKGLEASPDHDLTYTIEAVSASRRSAAQVFRDLGSKGGATGTTIVTGGGTTGGDADVPGELTFTPARYEYGMFTIENCSIPSANTTTLRGMMVYLFHVDETRSDLWALTDAGMSMDDEEDPVTLTVTYNPNKVCADNFLEGDYVIINDAGKFEIMQIRTITVVEGGYEWVLDRHNSAGAEGEAWFESQMAAHSGALKFYRVSSREFMTSQRSENLGGGQSIVSRFDMEAPGICVVAAVAACWNDKGYGPWTVVNCATATVPGIRTHVGMEYTFLRNAGLEAAAVNVAISKRVQFPSSIRALYATVETAPTGADLKVSIYYSADGGSNWTLIKQLTILATYKTSWTGGTEPSDQEIPTGVSWPPPFLLPEYLLNFQIDQIGSTIAGEKLTVGVLV